MRQPIKIPEHVSMYQIVAPHFVAGIIFENGFVVKTAPIVKYMVGWTLEHVHEYCHVKGWRVT